MSWYALLTHILFGICLTLVSASICWVMIKRVRILDKPNERSSHEIPTPTSGGIAIVVTFLIGVIALYGFAEETMIEGNYFLGFVFSSVLIAGISFYDDMIRRPFILKLVGHVVAAIMVMSFGLVMNEFSVPWLVKIHLGPTGYLVTFFWIIGLTNAYNFMDGIDGLAGGTAVITGFFFCLISFSQGSIFVYIICYTLIAGSFGFLLFNFPRSRLFMGDVGSTFLGFVFATLAIIAALYDHSHTSLFVMPLLLFHFIYDTFYTFIRRLVFRENVFTGHKTHLYQLFNQLGHSHTAVSGFYFAVSIAQGVGAYLMIHIPNETRLFVFIPFLIFQIIYNVVVVRKAKNAKLI
jgi:UDP-GlcNAc:undecaprenyl-phosphate GlcNAc-1-phosphate transferase